MKGQTFRKDLDAGNDWRQNEKGAIEGETARWHHRLKGHEFEQTPGYSERQKSLVLCSPWGHKVSDTIWQLNNSKMSLFGCCTVEAGKPKALFLRLPCSWNSSCDLGFPKQMYSSSSGWCEVRARSRDIRLSRKNEDSRNSDPLTKLIEFTASTPCYQRKWATAVAL